MAQPSAADLIEGLSLIASRAAAAILAVADPARTRRDKPDHSPVTAADEAAEAVILDGLRGLAPQIPVVSEESSAQRPTIGPGERYFLVDPLDGTREFLAGRDEYTVNIALVENHVPVIGVIAAPARGLLWRGAARGGAERLVLPPGDDPRAARETTAIHGRARPPAGLRVMLSRSHPDAATDRYLADLARAEGVRCGSSLKFCLLAEGAADLYPRLSPISQWDIAAGHALLVAAGGAVLAPDGGALRYAASGADFLMQGFIAWADRSAAARGI